MNLLKLITIKPLALVLWTPSQISTTMWLDAADATTVTLNGSNVSQWNDKSGNGHHATQSSSSLQPAYTSSGLNGKNVITFSKDELRVSNLSLNGSGWEFYLVVTRSSGTESNGRFLSLKSTSYVNDWRDPSGWLPLFQLGAGPTITSYNNGSAATPGYSSSLDTPYLLQSSYLASSLDFKIFTVSAGTKVNANTLNTNDGLMIGTSLNDGAPVEHWNGLVGEIVVVPTLSLSNAQKMEGYLAWKWGIQSGLPSGHPYKNAPPYL